MAFLSLGLNIEEPQSVEESQKAPKDLSEGSLSGSGLAALASKEAQQGSQVSSNTIPHNGTNGTAPKAEAAPIEPEKDNAQSRLLLKKFLSCPRSRSCAKRFWKAPFPIFG